MPHTLRVNQHGATPSPIGGWPYHPLMSDASASFTDWLARLPSADMAQWLEAAHFAIYLLGHDGRFLAVNRRFCELTGYRPEQLLGRTSMDITHPDDQAGGRQRTARLAAGLILQDRVDKRFVHADGHSIWVRVSVRRLPAAAAQDPPVLLAVAQEVGDDEAARAALARSETQLRLALEGSGAGLWDWDLLTDVVEFSRSFGMLLRYSGNDFRRDFLFRERLHPDDRDAAIAAVERSIAHGAPFDQAYRLRCFDEQYRWFQGRGMTHCDADGRPLRFSGILVDLQERYEVEQRLRDSERELSHLARHDPLTGLPNRRLWNERLTDALRDAQRQNQRLAVLMMDLDRFKDVNDSLGHGVGDELLRHVALRLSQRLRGGDTLARLGGDEFVWLMRHPHQPADAARLAQELQAALNDPWRTDDGHEVHLGSSIGIALFPEHGADAQCLMRAADAALYRAKADGRGTFCYYSDDMTRDAAERLTLESRLRLAVRDSRFQLVFQPQWGVATDRLVGAEALLRWHDPVLGDVSPARFVPVAEACGLMSDLGAWVLEQAAATLRHWMDGGWTEARLAINVSPRQFLRGQLTQQLRSALQRHRLPPEALELEITEGLLMERSDTTQEVLRDLRELGVRVAVDDFGVGYSSLAYLKRFAIHTLKIDRTFIAQLESDAEDRAICAAIIAMGHALGVKVLAEGVETEGQWRLLASMGCDHYQGYWRGGHPVSAERFAIDYLAIGGTP
jgi:diguanylate cyclase (GGDEF)-like protein/PAS domain S-box-containing protein